MYMLTESIADTVIVYLIIKKLSTPWKEWPAYELGLIDEDGKKLKKAKTSEERRAWTFFDRFIANLKRILQKFVGGSKMAAMLTAAFLLKDSLVPVVDTLITEDIELTAALQLEIKRYCNDLSQLPKFPTDFDEQEFEYAMEKYMPLVEGVISEDFQATL